MSGPWIVAFIVMALIVCINAWVTAGLLRRSTRLLEAAENALKLGGQLVGGGVPVGSRIPGFSLKNTEGETVNSAQILGRRGVLVLLDPECEPCQKLIDDLESTGIGGLGIPLYLVSGGEFPPMKESSLSRIGATVLYQHDDEASRALGTTSTPHAFVFDRGVVANKGFPNSLSDLAGLVEVGFGKVVTLEEEVTRTAV